MYIEYTYFDLTIYMYITTCFLKLYAVLPIINILYLYLHKGVSTFNHCDANWTASGVDVNVLLIY